MSLVFQQSEATAAQRRFPVYLVDATDGLTPETGEAAGQPQISKNGAAFGNTTATLTAIGNGAYYVELTAAELDTLGMIVVRYKSAATAEFNMHAQVVAHDVYDSVRLGLTALPNAAAEAAGGLYTRGTGAGQINQAANGQIDANVERLNNVAQSLLDLVDFADAGYNPATNRITGIEGTKNTLDDLNDITAAAAGGAAWDEDIVAAHGTADTAGLLLRALGALISQRTNNPTLNALLGVPDSPGEDVPSTVTDEVLDEAVASHVGAGSVGERIERLDVIASGGAGGLTDGRAQNLDNLDAAVTTRATPAQVNTEVDDVLRVDTQSLPGQATPPGTPTLVQAITWLYKVLRNKKEQTSTAWSLYDDAGTTVDSKATVSDDGTTATKEEIVSGP